MFLSASLINAALAHGEIPRKIRVIPISKLTIELKLLSTLFTPTENIITGILNI